MQRRTLTIATAVSTLMLAFTVSLFVAGYVLNPWDHYVSFGDEFHIGVWRRPGIDSRIIFFNDAEYGPYRGSIIAILDDEGNLHPPLEREICIGDTWGIYYRDFQWSESTVCEYNWGGSRLWTLMVSLWYPIIMFSTLPAGRVLFFMRRRAGDPVHDP